MSAPLVNKTILNDKEIGDLCEHYGMISPYHPTIVKESAEEKIISFGQSSFGYDIRVTDEFKIFTPSTGNLTYIDPKNFDPNALVDYKGRVCIIPPNSFGLARSVETFKVPRDVLGVCVGKSTYARCGIIVNVTPLEPGWEGVLTIEISNTTPLPCRIYAFEGIAQILWFRGTIPSVTYKDRAGKYQNQVGITLSKV